MTLRNMYHSPKELKKILESISIDKEVSLLKALKKMDELDLKLLIVTEKKSFKSVISIGDIQRAIIKGKSIDTSVKDILREEITVCYDDESIERVKSEMVFYRSEFMPVLNRKGEIINVIFWNDLFGENKMAHLSGLNVPVVIMAGGEGVRLKPLTNIIPKPLVPLGDKSIVEHIIDSFVKRGAEKFYLLINYKAAMIENYFEELGIKNYRAEFIREDKPLGTAGSLYLMKGKISETFFVSNCDILVDQDYHEVLSYHRQNRNELTIVGALKHLSIPYGTLEVIRGGLLKELKEKPDITLMVNSGMYILEPHLIDEIPEDRFFHITDLIEKIKNRKGRIGVFPVSEMSWLDIGDWNEFKRTQEIFSKKQFGRFY